MKYKSSIGWAALAILATAFLLVMPVPHGRHHRIIAAFLDLGHVPLFAVLTLGAIALLGRTWMAFVAMASLVVGGELIQALAPGRTPDVKDLVDGLVGVALAWCLVAWWHQRHNRTRLALLMLVLGCVPIYNVLPEFVDVWVGKRSFPILCDFTTPWEHHRWVTHESDVYLTRDELGIGQLLVEMADDPDDDKYPGVEFVPVVCDWRGYESLHIVFTTSEAIRLNISIRDQRKKNNYSERFNWEKTFEAGSHHLTFNLDEIVAGPKTMPIDLSNIDCVNFFIEVEDAPKRIFVRRVELSPAR